VATEPDSPFTRTREHLLASTALALSPEILEPVGRHFRISRGVHDALVTEIMLKRPGIVSIVGELVAAGVPEHVRMDAEWHLGSLTEPLDEPVEADRPAALGNEHVGICGVLPPELPRGSHLIATDWMNAWLAVLHPANVQAAFR